MLLSLSANAGIEMHSIVATHKICNFEAITILLELDQFLGITNDRLGRISNHSMQDLVCNSSLYISLDWQIAS